MWLMMALRVRRRVLYKLHLLHLRGVSQCEIALRIDNRHTTSGKLHVQMRRSLRGWNRKVLGWSVRGRYLETLLWDRCRHELLLLRWHVSLHLLWLWLLLMLLLRYHESICRKACLHCRS